MQSNYSFSHVRYYKAYVRIWMPKTIYRVVTLGKSGVGKTSLLENLVYERFNRARPHLPTVEDIYECTITTDRGSEERVHIYDTSGQTDVVNSTLRSHCVTTADGIVLVYSCSNCRESFTYIKDMRQEIDGLRGKDVPVVVVGMMSDSIRDAAASGESKSVAIWAQAQSLQHYQVLLQDRAQICEPFVWITSRLAAGGKRFLPKKN